ncbi:Membrane associated eicosanoid/glutathione metabolism-like domain protein, partial [Metarhizium majus ARSEF 297]
MTALLPLDLSRNLSLFTVPSPRPRSRKPINPQANKPQVPAAFGLALIPHLYAVGSAGFAIYDNSYPRAYRDTLTKDTSIDKVRKQRILRAEACSLNGLETIGLYAASVIVGNYAQLGTSTLNSLSIGYLVSRCAYTLSYVFIQNRRLSWLRTAIWQVTAAYIVMFWVKAGYKLL